MNVYGRVREDRLAAAVERVGSRILQRKSVPSVYRLVAGADTKNATLVKSEGCISQKLVAAEGLEPSLAEKQKTASSEQNSAKSQQINALEGEAKRVVICNPMQKHYTFRTLLSGKNVYQMCTGICRPIWLKSLLRGKILT